jgi:alpha-1,3-rhamnosyltransferase
LKELVTVAVTTYQSSLYVIETLDSIYNQTYPNIELVISDDCSSDNTVEVVNEWVSLEKNKKRFARIEVVTVPSNTGVSANCNRCIASAQSNWIKFIAGDDILFPNCIADNIDFVNENTDAKILFSQIKVYQDTFEEKNFNKITPGIYPNALFKDSIKALDQYKLLLVEDRIHFTPSYFFNKQAILKVGGYDESNRFVEDYPMWLKLTSSGVRLSYFHKSTVGYRIHSRASNNTGDMVLFKPSVLKSHHVRKEMAFAFLPWDIVMSEKFVYTISKFFDNNGLNKKTSLNSMLYMFLTVYCNPFQYIYAVKKRLPSNKNNPFYL